MGIAAYARVRVRARAFRDVSPKSNTGAVGVGGITLRSSQGPCVGARPRSRVRPRVRRDDDGIAPGDSAKKVPFSRRRSS